MKQGGREGTRRTGKGHTGVSAGHEQLATHRVKVPCETSPRCCCRFCRPFRRAKAVRRPAAAAAAFAPGTRGRTASAACNIYQTL